MALWVQALPAPGIRAVVPLSEIAAIVRQANGTRRQLLVTGRTSRLPVRYDAAGDVLVDALIRRLRRRTAGDPAPVPAGYPRARTVAHGRRHAFDLADVRLDSDRRRRDSRSAWSRWAQDVPARRHPRANWSSCVPSGRRAARLDHRLAVRPAPCHRGCKHPVGVAPAAQRRAGARHRPEVQEDRRGCLGVAGARAQRSRSQRHWFLKIIRKRMSELRAD